MHAQHNTPNTAAQIARLFDGASEATISKATGSVAATPGDVAVAFLSLTPGTHHLVAFNPFADPDPRKRKPGDTEGLTCVLPADAKKVRDWVNARNGQKNLHFTLNEVRPDFTGNKPAKRDIVKVRGGHLDVDLEGENSPEALAALWQKVDQTLPAGLEPTFTIASGGGYQLIFLLAEPISRDADDEEVQLAIEAQNRGLISLFDGDASTWNLDRLLRLPGTVNIPNARKQKIGRVQAEASLFAEADARHSLDGIAAKVAPITVVQRASTEPEIAEAWEALDDRAYEHCFSEEDLPGELRETLYQAKGMGNDKLRIFWEEGTAETSGRKATLASLFGWRKVPLSVEGYARLMWCWGWTHLGPDYCESSLTPRSLARAYVNTYLDKIPQREERDAKKAANEIRTSSFYEALDSEKPPQDVPGLRVVRGSIDAKAIPRRQWVVYPRFPRGDTAQEVGEPGVSKSSHVLNDVLAVVTGNEKLLRGSGDIGFDRLITAGPALVYNAEDHIADMERRLKVLMDFHGIGDDDFKYPIFLLSGIEAAPLVVMERKDKGAPLRRAPGADVLEGFIKRNQIVLAALDPQISLARGGIENDTDAMNDIMQELANIAARTNCCILTIQHTSKATRDAAGDMGAARGAFSQVGKIRSGYTLTKVDPKDAVSWGFDPTQKLIRMDYSKNNHAPVPDIPIIYRRHSGQVGNGTGFFGSAEDTFSGTSAERFEREGDSAPFLEIIGLGVKQGDAPQPLNAGQARRVAVAEAVAKVLGDREAVALPTLFHEIGGALNEAGVSKATSRPSITDLVKTSLAGAGVQIVHGGQNVLVNAEQRGVGPKASWFLVIRPVALEGHKALEGDGVFS